MTTLRVSEAEFRRIMQTAPTYTVNKTYKAPAKPIRPRQESGRLGSEPEERFALQCRAEGLTPEREYRFAPPRRWRIDAAFVAEKVAVEIEGAVWANGRHTRGSGFVKDLEKYNRLTADGWRLLRVSPAQVANGEAIRLVKEVLGR